MHIPAQSEIKHERGCVVNKEEDIMEEVLHVEGRTIFDACGNRKRLH